MAAKPSRNPSGQKYIRSLCNRKLLLLWTAIRCCPGFKINPTTVIPRVFSIGTISVARKVATLTASGSVVLCWQLLCPIPSFKGTGGGLEYKYHDTGGH
jgi:hypothetical protein